jgi:hypothetical protein
MEINKFKRKKVYFFQSTNSITVVKKMMMKLGVLCLLSIVAVLAFTVCPVKALLGDVGGYGKVDMRDVGIVAAAFGSYGPNYLYPGSPASARWDPRADILGKNVVNMLDIGIVASQFGQHD